VNFSDPSQVLYSGKEAFRLTGGIIPDAHEKIKSLGIGIAVLHWFGDNLPISGESGEIPSGYITAPLFKHWIKGRHLPNNGHFSYGPYSRIQGVGQFRVEFYMAAENIGGGSEKALTADVVDADAGTTFARTTFSNSQLSGEKGGFRIFSSNFKIPNNNRIEARIIAHGGASIFLYSLRWYVETI
jgi:hypothetical protein